jgi:ATP-dependent DNA helicase RecQ
MNKSRELLKRYWGFDSFRPLQEEIIDHTIYGHDSLVLLPTGGGKSICFQVPGLAREGITLVISPLISLMQDQVKGLIRKGIKAKEITSGMSFREIDIALDNARFGGLDFLYTSPERLQSKLFLERFKNMNVGLLVVDEAHCISEWGHDFRPSYRDIKTLRHLHPTVPIIALTATATKEVQQDILEQLQLRKAVIFEGPFTRPNLRYSAFKVENKEKEILNYCLKNTHLTGIIYCQTRKSVKDIARLLHAAKLSVGIYHGGLNQEDRKIMLDSWLTGQTKTMVATNAFGMGIDKPDVRYVLHYEFPNNLEAYFQEAGRAGRDGLEAEAIAYWEDRDLTSLKERIRQQFPDLKTVKTTYRALCNHLKIAIGSGKEETYPFEFTKLTQKFQLDNSETYHSLKILELNNDLVFTEGVFNPTRLKIAIGNTELYSFQIKHEVFSPLISVLSRSYPGIFEQFFELNENEIAKRLKTTSKQVIDQLKQLEKYGIIDISWQSSLPTALFKHERLPDDYLQISSEAYQNRKDLALKRLTAAIRYLNADTCRLSQILHYFGQTSEKCQTCDVCMDEKRQKVSDQEIIALILSVLQTPASLESLQSTIDIQKEVLASAVQQLMMEEKIDLKEGLFSLKGN